LIFCTSWPALYAVPATYCGELQPPPEELLELELLELEELLEPDDELLELLPPAGP
jgi:hypothetical protein